MDATHRRLLDEVRGLVATRALLDDALAGVVRACNEAGVDATRVAGALGVHRSTLYRRYLPPARPERP
jgi:transcriptional regulator of acetoin/glycerol metabolism